MYITVKSIKRDLGFKGIEISDVLIGFPIIAICVLMFSLTKFKMLSIVLLMIGIFLLLPITVSKKNRMYKVLFLIGSYCIREKCFVYSTKQERKGRFDIYEIKRKLKQ